MSVLTFIYARVCTQDPAEGFILNYTLLIGDASFSNFQKVCVSKHGHILIVWYHSLLLCITLCNLSIHPSIDDFSCQIIDLKGTPRAEQNDLLDFFVTITSTKPELEQTSFLTELDMDPSTTSALAFTTVPNSSRVASPGIGGGGAGEALFASLASPPLSNTPSGAETPPRGDANAATKQVFSDIRRLMSFAVRRDTTAPQ
jgi:vacuolar protein sorting-associated protein 53